MPYNIIWLIKNTVPKIKVVLKMLLNVVIKYWFRRLKSIVFPDRSLVVKLSVEKVTIYTELRVKNDHRSEFSNLSNWKEEAWKKKNEKINEKN